MISDKTRKYAKQVMNHFYVDWELLPMVGDFVGQFSNVLDSLKGEGVITDNHYREAHELLERVEKDQDKQALSFLLEFLGEVAK